MRVSPPAVESSWTVEMATSEVGEGGPASSAGLEEAEDARLPHAPRSAAERAADSSPSLAAVGLSSSVAPGVVRNDVRSRAPARRRRRTR